MIRVSGVSKKFGVVSALDGVSLDVAPGDRVAFIGSNGSGKTTLLRCILGLVRFEGRITVGGVDVAREPELALRSVAYIPQVAPPIEAPASEVVRAHAELRGLKIGAVEAKARDLGLEPQSYRDKRFRDLSGGMKQKLLAALALATEARVLVCDEPTANLDTEARAVFFRMLEERPSDSVVVLCSHRTEEVTQLVDRVVELRDGRLLRDTPIEHLLEDLRAFLVEVELRPGSGEAASFLEARGFRLRSDGSYEARLARDEKLGLVARFLREHEGAIADLAISPVQDMAVALEPQPAEPTKLRAVS